MNDVNMDIKDSVQSHLARNTAVTHEDPVSIVEFTSLWLLFPARNVLPESIEYYYKFPVVKNWKV